MIVVYIASPYTEGEVAINVRRQLDMADLLISRGYCPIVPLYSHFQHIVQPRPWEDWMKIDREKVLRSDVVLRLEGKSKGADREVKIAKDNNIPVVYSIADLLSANIKERQPIIPT